MITLYLLPLQRLPLPVLIWLRALPAVAIGGVASYWFIERAAQILAPLFT
jgi:hypothetical protein